MEYLWKAVGMSANDGHIARFWVLIIKRSVLLDGKLEFIVLAARSSSWIFANMRGGERVLLDLEERHPVVLLRPELIKIYQQ
jgi:hypothetical protein